MKLQASRKRFTIVLAALIGFVSLGLAPAYAVDERVVDVVAVTWPGAVAPAGDVNAVSKVIDTEVNADWLKFTAMYGAPTDRGISFKTGQILKDPIALISKMACQGIAASDFMNSIRPEAYKRLGITDYSKRYLVVIAPKAGCVWSGRAQMGGPKSVSGTLILHDSASGFVISHELGHTFGLGHSNFLRCDNAANDGAWSDTCKAVEYGGTIDVMGNIDTTSPLNTYHQWRMGYLEDSQIKQVWQSETINLAPSDFANGTKAIFIRDGKAGYWIEYRRKTDGVAYKPGIGDVRETPVSELRDFLEASGSEVAWHDPLVSIWEGSKPVSLDWPCDVAILATRQPGMNLNQLVLNGVPILDCTNSLTGQAGVNFL